MDVLLDPEAPETTISRMCQDDHADGYESPFRKVGRQNELPAHHTNVVARPMYCILNVNCMKSSCVSDF